MDYGKSWYKLLIEIQHYWPYCLNFAMFLSQPGESPATEAGCQMKHETTVNYIMLMFANKAYGIYFEWKMCIFILLRLVDIMVHNGT